MEVATTIDAVTFFNSALPCIRAVPALMTCG